jgi:hypothetical protein
VLQFPDGGKLAACDFFSITKEGKIVLTEVKAPTKRVLDIGHLSGAREQLRSTVEQAQKRGLAGELETFVELAIPAGTEWDFKSLTDKGYVLQNGFVYLKGKPLLIKDTNLLIKVVEI